jgi:transcriptional antiterminator Rof (Rho-off)
MATQELSSFILDQMKSNSIVTDRWFSGIVNSRLEILNRTGKVEPYYSAIIKKAPNDYPVHNLEGFVPDSGGLALLRMCNFSFGYPIMACSFSLQLTYQIKDGPQQQIFLITLETPLRKSRQIYIQCEIEGVKRYIRDDYMSLHTTLPPDLNRFNFLIATEQNNTQ